MAESDIFVRARPWRGTGLPILVFPAATFLSAALLFCVEPMFSKMVLPVLGGSAAVWSVAMVVFQGLLLAGYLYAHLLTRYLSLRHAALIHVCALAVAALCLPIAISAGFTTPPLRGVSFWLIGLFLASIGLPCFVLSASAPLLQSWFAQAGGRRASNAYFLYRASNLGSFIVLLAYPFAIEPQLGLWLQSRLWSIGYVLLVFAIAACGAVAMRAPVAPQTAGAPAFRQHIDWRGKFAWSALGFIPSGLLVAVTAHIATDVASAPFLWIMPLALYLLTFVFAFADQPLLPSKVFLVAQPVTTAALAVLLLWTGKISWSISLAGHLIAFFVAAMVCQAELYRRRPDASQLTQFYVWMSLGGVLGGIFAGLIAPQIFSTVLEYPLLVLGALLVRRDVWTTARSVWLKDGAFVVFVAAALAVPFVVLKEPVAYFAVAVMTLAVLLAVQGRHPARLVGIAAILLLATNLYDPSQSVVARARSFYGAYKVVDVDGGKFRVLYHGTTAHGSERLQSSASLKVRPEPLTYYYRGGPFSQAIYATRARTGGAIPHVALVGLGVGALTCYRQPGEDWTIYELDPLIVSIARNRSLFRSVSSCAPDARIVVGDGRLTLRAAKPGIDLLMLDIFSSDSVPLHMLTKEAFALYKARLSLHGVIAFNISNSNLELADAVAASAAANGMVTFVKLDGPPPPHTLRLRAEIAIVTRSLADMRALKLDAGWHIVSPKSRVWTDDYSDMLSAIVAKIRS